VSPAGVFVVEETANASISNRGSGAVVVVTDIPSGKLATRL